MPELKEVFEMVTKQTEPDVDSWRQQEQKQRRTTRNRKVGAFAMVAALLVVAVIVAIALPQDARRPTDVGVQPPPSSPHVLDLTTGAATALPDSLPEASLYAVSPDGTMIAGAPCCIPPNPVWVANIDGTGVRQITPQGIDGFAPRWSPDGSRLVYQERDASTGEIGNLAVVDVATGEHTTITDLPDRSYGGWSMHPIFTADGRSVLFHLPRGPSGGRLDLVSVPVTGGDTTVLRRDAMFGASSPLDGSLVYVDPTTWTLFVADADGRNSRILVVVGEETPRRALWSPAGSEIAYEDSNGIHIVDATTGEEVSRLDTGDGLVAWSW
jgi:Tol biopolymer transport system component